MDWANGKPSDGTPIGEFNCIIQSCVSKDTKAGTGKYANFNFVISDGERAGESFFFMANYENPNKVTEKIAKNEINKIMQVLGMTSLTEYSQFVGGKVRVTTEPGKGERTKFKFAPVGAEAEAGAGAAKAF